LRDGPRALVRALHQPGYPDEHEQICLARRYDSWWRWSRDAHRRDESHYSTVKFSHEVTQVLSTAARHHSASRRHQVAALLLRPTGAFLCALGLIALALPAIAAPEVNWHARAEDAQAASLQSGKPVYLYIFSPQQSACRRMRAETLTHPDVVALLNKHFECCAVNSVLTANKVLADRYAWGVAKDSEGKTRFGSMPAHVLMNAKGDPYLTFWGYMPARALVVKVTEGLDIIRLKKVLADNESDARANADLGHVLLQIQDFKNARKFLERARELDPKNQAGALEDSTLDLIVLRMAEDPLKSHGELVKFRKRYAKSDRLLEAIYWQAVALYAQQKPAAYRAALKVLQPFRDLSVDDPRYRSRWATEADRLERSLRILLDSR